MGRPPFEATVSAWVGMRDAADIVASTPAFFRGARNVVPVDTTLGAGWEGRPGFRMLGARLATGRVQWLGMFARADSAGVVVQHTMAVAAGRVWEFSWLTRTWTERVLPPGLTLSTTAMVSAVTMANHLIITDGVHKPIAWTGAGFVELAAAPVFFGPVTTYYAKLFGIMATDRRTIAWSNEADPFAGYTTDQQWTLAQSDADPLYALAGTNEVLYVFRARSITAIAGAVDSEFQSSGTRDGVSETTGTTAPFAVVPVDTQLYFLSADGRPHVLTPGGGVRDLWADLRETVAGIPHAALGRALGTHNDALELVQWHVRELGEAEASLGLWYSTRTGHPVSLCSGWTCTALGELLDGDERAIVAHGSATGHVYLHDATSDPSLNDDADALDGGVRAIEHAVALAPFGASVDAEKKVDRVDLVLRITGAIGPLTVTTETPYGESSLSVDLAGRGGGARWDTARWDEAGYAAPQPEAKVSVGVNATGRWVAVTLRHAALHETFGLSAAHVSGFYLQAPPKAR